jgi:hypothetical protein
LADVASCRLNPEGDREGLLQRVSATMSAAIVNNTNPAAARRTKRRTRRPSRVCGDRSIEPYPLYHGSIHLRARPRHLHRPPTDALAVRLLAIAILAGAAGLALLLHPSVEKA